MRIKLVTYGRLFNLGHYENERVELAAELPEGADHELAVESLARLVHAIGQQRAEERGADRDAASKEHGAKVRLECINADIDAAQARFSKALAFLKAQGVNTDGLEYNDDIPF